MHRWRSIPILILTAIAISIAGIAAFAAHEAPWVAVNASGKLVYRTLPRGDRIVDFSYAGYRGGGIALPKVPVQRTVTPSGGDDTAAIQKAIDEVSALPLKAETNGEIGFRGAILLAPGVFNVSQTLAIASSGVVLRGSGSSATTLKLTGEPHVAIAIAGKLQWQTVGMSVHIAQPYLPSGSQTITLDDASSIAAGDTIRITRYTTPEWLRFMGMDHMTRDGKDEHWVGRLIATYRTVTARKGNELTLDVPLTDSYDRAYLPAEGAEVVKVSPFLPSGGIEEDGIESLHIVAPPRSVAFTDPLFRAVTLYDLRDAWVRDLMIDDTTEGIAVNAGASRITIQDVSIHHKATITSPAKPADFLLGGGQILVLRASSVGDTEMYIMTGARNQGPNVVMDSVFHGDGHVQPHQRWSTGILVDNVQVPGGGIDLMNRGEMGTGHGWAIGWGVVWNSSASTMLIQQPPGAANWAIGCSGEEQKEPMKIMGVSKRDLGPNLPQGLIESPFHRVQPASLYRAQLAERLGPAALKALEP